MSTIQRRFALLFVVALAVTGIAASSASAAVEVRDPLTNELCEFQITCDRDLSGTIQARYANGAGQTLATLSCELDASVHVNYDGHVDWPSSWEASPGHPTYCGQNGNFEDCGQLGFDSFIREPGSPFEGAFSVDIDNNACIVLPGAGESAVEHLYLELNEDATQWTLHETLLHEADSGYPYDVYASAQLEAEQGLALAAME